MYWGGCILKHQVFSQTSVKRLNAFPWKQPSKLKPYEFGSLPESGNGIVTALNEVGQNGHVHDWGAQTIPCSSCRT